MQSAQTGIVARITHLVARGDHLIGMFPAALTLLVMRIALAVPFWRSGVLKWESFPFEISPIAVLLFEDEFGFPFPVVSAHLAALAEVILPVLLVLGLFTRYVALGLAVMTVVIQFTVPDGWPTHILWFGLALDLMSHGGGNLALDRLWMPRREG
ncbi:MAG TPA: DoxX family protein [Micropepsaceae bacterium]|nr:DoxX family protein [Micropepsaceae bacterium]